ncbi:S8/S53 family peptidase [Halorubrum pallidum]
MSNGREAKPADSTRSLRPLTAVRAVGTAVLVTLLAGVLLVALASSGAAAVDAAGVNAVGAPDDAHGANETTPLDGTNETIEVVVRFTPIENPDDLGTVDADGTADTTDTSGTGNTSGTAATPDDHRDAVVDDLREHATSEQDAFDEFAAAREGVTIERDLWLANAMVVTVDADAVSASALLSVQNVTAVHENVEIEPVGGASSTSHGPSAAPPPRTAAPAQITADPSGRATAGLRQIDAPTAWERFGTRGAGATVAVIDTGADPRHRDIDLDGWAAFDQRGALVSDDLADASDSDGHGTHVAGTVAGGNASGTHIGVAPAADLHAIDVFAENETATFAGVIAAMEHGTTDGDADVLQMSLGAPGAFREFVAPVRNARAAGAVVVVAAGNEGENTSTSPGNVHDALAVGAVDGDGAVPPFSSGESVDAAAAFETYPDDWPDRYVVPDVTAPGVGVVSAEANTTATYVQRQGTSTAAPHVSGVAALAVAATDGRVDDATLQAAIVETAVHPANATASDDRYGHGVVDAPAAVGAAVERTPPEPSATDGDNETDGNGSNGETDSDPPDGGPATDDATRGFGTAPALAALTIAAALASVAVRDP